MHLFKFKSSLIVLALVMSIMFPSVSYALESPASKPSSEKASNGSTIVANTNVDSYKITSQYKNTFGISFTISNGVGLQTGIKYGVQLMKDGSQIIYDTKVYEGTTTIYENSKVTKEVTYTAPQGLSGDYRLILVVSNESNYPFGTVIVGKVKLTTIEKGLSIQNDSCYVQVEGEKGSPRYQLTQTVDISTSESLKLTCTAVNESTTELTLTPSFETRYSGPFGAIASPKAGSMMPLSFAKSEKKAFTVLLPKFDKPQSYSAKLILTDKNISSNPISVNFIIRGIIASIDNISLNSDYYKSGDKGEIALLWLAVAGNFERSRGQEAGGIPKVFLNASIKNEKGGECTRVNNFPLVKDFTNPTTKVPFSITDDCMNPSVSATITDEKGTVLDQKGYTFKSNPDVPHTADNKGKDSNNATLYIVLGIAALLTIIALYRKSRKSNITI